MPTRSIVIVPADGTWVVRAGGAVIADSDQALELREEGFEPVIYFPREDVGMALMEPSATRTTSPFMGEAAHFSIVAKSGVIADAAWSYETPLPEVARIAGHVAFYPRKATIEQV